MAINKKNDYLAQKNVYGDEGATAQDGYRQPTPQPTKQPQEEENKQPSTTSVTPKDVYGSSIYDDALAKAKREQNYKAYYNSAIQAYNMKNRAQKYLDNALANQGLNTQGYGSSAHVGINNQAINLYSQAQSDYNTNAQQITEDAMNRKEEKDTELDNQLITFIQNAIDNGDYDSIDKYLENYGYKKDGEWTNLSDDRQAYIRSMIDTAGDTSSTNQWAQYYSSIDDLLGSNYSNRNGETYTIGEGFNNQTNTLFDELNKGTIGVGDYVHMNNNWGDNVYFVVTKNGLKQVTQEEYTQNCNGGKNCYGIYGEMKNENGQTLTTHVQKENK